MRVFITGGSRGIGKAIAEHMADAGHFVATCARQNDASDGRILALSGDVADYDKCAEMFDAAVAAFGGIDLLVNNAAISHVGYFADMKPAQWRSLVDANLNGVINFSHLAVRQMLTQPAGGHIINISSVWGARAASCEVIYSATKGGVDAFTRSLAKEVGDAGIRANALACGVVDTGMNDFLSDDEARELVEQIPMGRFATAREVAEAVDMIIKTEYLNGQIITLDGGWML